LKSGTNFNFRNYGSAYTAAAAAAAVYGNLGVGQSASQAQQQSSSVFGSSTTNPYATYSNSVAASYGYGNQSTSAASMYAAQAAQAQAQVQASQVSRLSADAAYAAAAGVAQSQYSAFSVGQLAGFGSQSSAGTTVGYGRPTASATSQAAKSLAALANANKSALTINSPSSYSNYDAAVYAAASSYLHSKATGTSNMWMMLNITRKVVGGVGRGGTFANKRFSSGTGVQREAQQFYCEVCKISCAGQLTYKEHLEGQRHKKKEALAKGENNPSLPKSKVSFRCDLCNVTCTGQDTYNAHVRGAKHQKTLTLCKKLGKPIPSTEPTIIPPSEMGGVIPPPPNAVNTTSSSNTNVSGKRVVGISTVNFVGGAKLSTIAGQLEAKKQQVLQPVGTAGTKATEESAVQTVKGQTEELQALIAAEQNLKPVGEEFVEAQRDATGKLLQYLCKLCDCKFSDPNAKEIHLKGRRHRLQYKMKVDPNLEVEVKQTTSRRGSKYERGRGSMGGMMARGGPPPPPSGIPVPRNVGLFGPIVPGIRGPWFGNGPIDGRRFESTDDRHVQAKHTSIYPNDEQLTVIESLVTETEKALKKVSDYFNEREFFSSDRPDTKPVATNSSTTDTGGEGTKETAAPEKDRLLKGVMRVGMLSKGLLLKDDTEVHLVVLCSHIPGCSLLKEVALLIPLHYEKPEGSTVELSVEESTASMILRQSSVPVQCRITLTSREFREDVLGNAAPPPPPGDALDKEVCLKALAQLRHAKWFQALKKAILPKRQLLLHCVWVFAWKCVLYNNVAIAEQENDLQFIRINYAISIYNHLGARCIYLQSCQVTLRILRDIRARIESWRPLNDWMCELLVEKVLSSCLAPLSVGDALRRVFEAVASGVLLKTGPGLPDPCEKVSIDVLAPLTGQQREAITASAQHALRLIAFNQLYKVGDLF
uniref:DZF domain-containing protein n=1 Tax=Angiostrongylus costaricensis TaxID=334426 RepID=A0A158PLH3_ANGCS